MYTLGTIREFKTRNFTVRVTAQEEDALDLSVDDDGSVREAIDRGELIAFCAKAAVYYRGNELATDYLGGCVYKSIADFMDHKECGKQNKLYAAKGETGRCGSYFTDMVKTVCREAREELRMLQNIKVRRTDK